jgi:galactonate dehydratase
MGKIASIEYFRVPPRWLFVKITDEAGNVGWGEASLEGHTQAVEGCLDAWISQYTGMEAEYVRSTSKKEYRLTSAARLNTFGKSRGAWASTVVVLSS